MRKLKFALLRVWYFFIKPLRFLYWFLFRPSVRGAKCVIEHEGKVLLVRLSYAHKGWTLPGGKVERGESFEEGVRREVLEETGIRLGGVTKFLSFMDDKDYKVDTIEVFCAKVPDIFYVIDGFEIVDARWVSPDNLPLPHPQRLEEIIRSWGDFKRGKQLS